MTESREPAVILIVDDKPENLDVLSEMLRQCGHKVRPATKGKLALKAARKQAPDLILLDIMMSEMDGYEVCRQLKADPDLRNIPVIFISALTQAFDKVTALRCGGVDYISKPFQVEEVVARVETHLQLRRYQTALEEQNKRLDRTLHELKATQARMVQSEKMASLGVLTAGIAHEINNPVNFITSGIAGLRSLLDDLMEVMERYCSLDTKNTEQVLGEIVRLKEEIGFDEIRDGLYELIDNIQTGSERTAEIVKSLRTFARLDEDDEKAADIHQNIDSTLMMLRNQYKHLISIKKNWGDIPPIFCYPGKLNQVFMNILGNAIEAIRSKPTRSSQEEISIRTAVVEREGEPFVEIEIRDTGGGIPDEIRNRIFEPFFSSKEVGKGNGLGLPISLAIVESHRGAIEVVNNHPSGAVFRIYLPMKVERRGE
ncbi:MAG: response regulator [Deltaproteobacteria bacterium]